MVLLHQNQHPVEFSADEGSLPEPVRLIPPSSGRLLAGGVRGRKNSSTLYVRLFTQGTRSLSPIHPGQTRTPSRASCRAFTIWSTIRSISNPPA